MIVLVAATPRAKLAGPAAALSMRRVAASELPVARAKRSFSRMVHKVPLALVGEAVPARAVLCETAQAAVLLLPLHAPGLMRRWMARPD